ncbi:MAG: OmpA family protein [Bacteroidota bacterium]
MRNVSRIVPVILFFVLVFQSLGQQQSLIGHRAFLGYANPALMKGGNYGSIRFLHRSQWEELGPSANSLFITYPFRKSNSFLSPKALGVALQYEEVSFLTQTRLELSMANTLVNSGSHAISLGISGGIHHLGVQTGELDLEELVDPELADLDRQLRVTNKVGLSWKNSLFEWGISSSIRDFNRVGDYGSTLVFDIPLRHPSYRVQTLLSFRSTPTFETQLEGQVRLTYRDKINFTSGFRQHFGLVFQLGILLNKATVSYGAELPMSEKSRLGLTHELLASYLFESPASVRHREDSVYKVKRDSINKVRVDNLRKRQQEAEVEKEDRNRLDIIGEAEELPDTTVVTKTQIKEGETNGKKDGPVDLEDLTNKPDENSHVLLSHIGFEPGLYLLKPSSYGQLDRLYHYVQHHKSLHFEIQGHTDNSGSAETNLELSDLRAKTVYNYLLSRGVDPARMNVVGYGEEFPLYPNDTEEHKEMNRRIEIVFIKN